MIMVWIDNGHVDIGIGTKFDPDLIFLGGDAKSKFRAASNNDAARMNLNYVGNVGKKRSILRVLESKGCTWEQVIVDERGNISASQPINLGRGKIT